MKLTRIGLLILFLGLGLTGYAQPCREKLKEATRAYDEGKINEVRQLLSDEDCLKQLDKNKRAEAYRLLTNSGLYTDDRDLAEQNMELFLRIFPEYKPNRTKDDGGDSPEFIELYDKFYTKPIYLYGLKLGATYSVVQPTKIFSVDNNAEPGTYTSGIGFLIGGMFDLPINDNLHLGIEGYYATRGFTNTESLLNFAETQFTENQALVELPIYARYLFRKIDKKFRPFVSAGVYGNFLLSSKGEIIRSDKVGSGAAETKREVERLEVDMATQRRKLGLGAMLGAGFLLKTKAGFFTVDLRYNLGLSNIVDPTKRGSNEILYGRYGYIDDDMTISPFTFSLGFYIPKYNPKLKKQFRRNTASQSSSKRKSGKRKSRRKKRGRK